MQLRSCGNLCHPRTSAVCAELYCPHTTETAIVIYFLLYTVLRSLLITGLYIFIGEDMVYMSLKQLFKTLFIPNS
jgi:hypothetical protein